MKKFSDVIETIRKVNEQELSDLQKSYREYFTDKLKKFDAESPADLNDEQKKEFFNEIKKDWEKGKGVKESEDANESDIKSKEDFAKFAKDKLKKVHGDDFDEEKAQEVIDGLSKDAEKDDNWGAAVGRLNKA